VGAWAAESSHVRSPTAECQTSLRIAIVSESGQFRERSLRSERKLPVSRLLAGGACTHLAGRSLAAILLVFGDRRSLAPYCYLADMRSIAASGISGRTAVFAGLGSLRPTERNGTEMQPAKLKSNGVEQAESDESGQRCGQNRADIWGVGSGSVLAPLRDQAQVAAR